MSDERYTAILERLTKARKSAGLSLSQAAKLTGRSVSGLSDIENGRCSMYVHSLLEFGDVYGVDLTWLVTGINPTFDTNEVVEKLGASCESLSSVLEMLSVNNPIRYIPFSTDLDEALTER